MSNGAKGIGRRAIRRVGSMENRMVAERRKRRTVRELDPKSIDDQLRCDSLESAATRRNWLEISKQGLRCKAPRISLRLGHHAF